MSDKPQDLIQSAISECVPASCSIYASTRKQKWSGSGFHIGNGVVITASHVAPPERSVNIEVTFDGRVVYPCTLLGSDPNVDVAALKISGDWQSVPHVVLGNSDMAELGEVVAVIGAPEGWHDTVTVGRISNMHQSLGASGPSPAWNDVMFVDAKILQGVSGGMCIGVDGLVLGSVIGVTGLLAQFGVGENVICPSSKILKFVQGL